MISSTREEREWFLRNIAQGLVEYMGAVEPPVQVEEMLRHPPDVYGFDFGVVDMYSNLWDATFARPPSRRGSIFVRVNLQTDQRRFALARETLSALITSKHGRLMGLADLLMDTLQESAEYFARHLLAPEQLVDAFRERGGKGDEFAEVFGIPEQVAEVRYIESVSAIH
ncbi:MAG: ImmA/IrrE family metallo-endopeptidase [Anaerolineales bacterium]|nr:ImmA/IrrE family metallo-endopeptidase [Anaerolineales bacterium]